MAYSFFAASMLIGIYICIHSSWWLALIGLLSMAVGYFFYTGGPLPIAYTPFGEVTAGLFMGVIIIGLAFFIQTGTIVPEIIILSVPTSILIGAILLSNNIRDLDGDQENGRKTLAILVGRQKCDSRASWDVHHLLYLVCRTCFFYRHGIGLDFFYRISEYS
ncbi:hypothetical protein GCM10020331_029850 [Ectobacillus funiculus]